MISVQIPRTHVNAGYDAIPSSESEDKGFLRVTWPARQAVLLGSKLDWDSDSKGNVAEWLRKVTDISLKPPLLYTYAHTYTACMHTTNTWKKKIIKKSKPNIELQVIYI